MSDDAALCSSVSGAEEHEPSMSTAVALAQSDADGAPLTIRFVVIRIVSTSRRGWRSSGREDIGREHAADTVVGALAVERLADESKSATDVLDHLGPCHGADDEAIPVHDDAQVSSLLVCHLLDGRLQDFSDDQEAMPP
ncbi:hypothetical protein ABT294_29145 [Nonomuraea sp. NPDC000554]|uniref:hypothetical protein n=1 Tax=Nonomuraea sp. NPDC000554 TaxID=3154259 RepID=UPI00332C55CA